MSSSAVSTVPRCKNSCRWTWKGIWLISCLHRAWMKSGCWNSAAGSGGGMGKCSGSFIIRSASRPGWTWWRGSISSSSRAMSSSVSSKIGTSSGLGSVLGLEAVLADADARSCPVDEASSSNCRFAMDRCCRWCSSKSIFVFLASARICRSVMVDHIVILPFVDERSQILKSPGQGQLRSSLSDGLFTLVGVNLLEASRCHDPRNIMKLSRSTIVRNFCFCCQHSCRTIPSCHSPSWCIQRLVKSFVAISRRLLSLVIDQSTRVVPHHLCHLGVVGQVGLLSQDELTVMLFCFLSAEQLVLHFRWWSHSRPVLHLRWWSHSRPVGKIMSIKESHGVGEVAAKDPFARAVATHIGHSVESSNQGPCCKTSGEPSEDFKWASIFLFRLPIMRSTWPIWPWLSAITAWASTPWPSPHFPIVGLDEPLLCQAWSSWGIRSTGSIPCRALQCTPSLLHFGCIQVLHRAWTDSSLPRSQKPRRWWSESGTWSRPQWSPCLPDNLPQLSSLLDGHSSSRRRDCSFWTIRKVQAKVRIIWPASDHAASSRKFVDWDVVWPPRQQLFAALDQCRSWGSPCRSLWHRWLQNCCPPSLRGSLPPFVRPADTSSTGRGQTFWSDRPLHKEHVVFWHWQSRCIFQMRRVVLRNLQGFFIAPPHGAQSPWAQP